MGTVFTAFNSGTDEAAANLTTEAAAGFQSPRTGSWTYETGSTVIPGGASVEVTNANPNTAVWTRVLGSVTTFYFDVCVLVTAMPSADAMFLQTRLDGGNKAQVQFNADGSIVLKNGNTTVNGGGGPQAGYMVANQFLRIQWGLGVGGLFQQARVWTSATVADLLNNPADVTWTGAYSGGAFNQFRIVVLDAVNVTQRLHRLIGDDSTWPVSGGASNVAPTANAGPDVDTYEGGDLVTLNGTGSSDSDGTIASYSWRQITGPTVNLSNPAVASPTFTALAAAGIATFGLRVTDDDGAQSTEDTVTIEWSDEPAAVPTSDKYDTLLGGAVGATVNTSNSDFDNVTAASWVYAAPSAGTGVGAAVSTASGTVKVLTFDVTATGIMYADCPYVIDDLSVGPWYIMRALSGSTLRASVRVNTDGSVQCRNASTANASMTVGRVQAGQPFRVAWYLSDGVGQQARLFTGSNLHGTVPSSATQVGTYDQGTFDHIGFGNLQPATNGGSQLEVIGPPQIKASTWPDPFGGVAVTPSSLYALAADGSYTPLNIYAL